MRVILFGINLVALHYYVVYANYVDPPEDIKISTSPLGTDVGTSYDIEEGENLTLDCQAQDANPVDVTYKWTQENGNFTAQDSNSLEIDDIQRTQNGRYRCTASNAMTPSGRNPVAGMDRKAVTVNVQCEYPTSCFS